MISAVLAFAVPKIQEMQDAAIVDQSIRILRNIDETVTSIVQGGEGNKRTIEISLTKGVLILDGVQDQIIFEIESSRMYSEPGVIISDGNLKISTEQIGRDNKIKIWRNYSGLYNISYRNEEAVKTLSKAAINHKLILTHQGFNLGQEIINLDST